MEWKKSSRLRFMNKTALLLYSISIFFICRLLTSINTKTPFLDIRLTGKADFYSKEFEKAYQKMNGEEIVVVSEGKRGGVSLSSASTSRRLLGGPGSSPPRCSSKCGRCTPCKPVHVPVPPGTPVTAEYYPEAWRCKCGNRLYMP